ncbi:hypothetical protein H1C71_041838 [Ictidomys tridecemlineatus]|nr:hypothetical protein H1C71_041838 [Ictidomys tridecemlineatus]KAG3284121.1 hypothetical protein H1C71_041838 [Ictidomys tridecemlineatus]
MDSEVSTALDPRYDDRRHLCTQREGPRRQRAERAVVIPQNLGLPRPSPPTRRGGHRTRAGESIEKQGTGGPRAPGRLSVQQQHADLCHAVLHKGGSVHRNR